MLSPLLEVSSPRQRQDEDQRRWFSSNEADLFVWYAAKSLTAFEFCCHRKADEICIRWREGQHLHVFGVDDGEQSLAPKCTPIAIPVDSQAHARALEALNLVLITLEPEVAADIDSILRQVSNLSAGVNATRLL